MPDVRESVAGRGQVVLTAQEQAVQAAARMESELVKVLPQYISPERMIRLATTAIKQSADLAECSAVSIGGALLTAGVLGLEPNTPTQECYLIPRKDKRTRRVEATLQVGYQGWLKLWQQHPRAGFIDAQAVYPGDEFWWRRGTDPKIHHVPNPKGHEAGSEPTHYYAVAELIGSSRMQFEVLTADEVRTLRNGNEGPKGDIADPQRWMERKVPLRQLLKVLPKSTALALAATADDMSGRDLMQTHVTPSVRVDQEAPPPGDPPAES
jgi:recombination protein RecT